MSAFGYQSGYNSTWRNQAQPENPNQNAIFSIAPEMPQPNFQPTPGDPWADPRLNVVGSESISQSGNFGMTHSGNTSPLYARDPWANPLDALFPTLNMNQGKMAIGGQYNTTPFYGYTDPSQIQGAMGQPDQVQLGTRPVFNNGNNSFMGKNGSFTGTPQNAQQLAGSIGGLSLDQLMRMSSGGSSLADKFSGVAQNYADAYANPNYGKRIYAQQPTDYGGNNLSQSDTMDYLQKAYGNLLTRMNNNYLL